MQNYAGSERWARVGSDVRRAWFDGDVNTIDDTTTTLAPLTAADRCDRCGAQAYVRVVLPTGELFFCGHHARVYADAYRATALEIQDETDRLIAQAATR